ncbi:MAG TPA: biotin/lipoyl-containing protein [Actinomycetota bacterium]
MLLQLAQELPAGGGTAVVVKGIIAVVIAVTIFIGSVWLLLSLVLGARLGYFVTASLTFGIICILSVIWFGSKLGPKGVETTWIAIGAGPNLQKVEGYKNAYDLSGYPDGGGWEVPKPGRELVKGADDTATEAESAKPVLDTFVSSAISVISGVRESEAKMVKGEISLIPQKYAISDVRMKEATVDGKPSLIAAAKAVPSQQMVADDLGGPKEGDITDILVKPGDAVTAGQPIVRAKTDKGPVEVKSPGVGRIVTVALAKGDKIKPGVPYATLDISGQPGQPQPVEVAAVRVRGAVRTPPLYYLIASLLLFALHMRGLARTERLLKAQAQPA